MNSIKINNIERKTATVSFSVPAEYISDMWKFLKSVSARQDLKLSENIFSVTLEEREIDEFCDSLAMFAKVRKIAFVNCPDEKLSFGDLKVGDIFIGFPTDGDNAGHGGYLDAYHSFFKIEEDDSYNNAERADGSKIRIRLRPEFLVLMID